MTAGKEIELPIARIAQLARAGNSHDHRYPAPDHQHHYMGTIKANFPARMALK